jgi:hypothetical protein
MKQKQGFTFTTILFFVFLIAKLAGWITWSWWWVTCPLWAGWAIIFLIFALPVIGGLLLALATAIIGRK